MNISIVTHSSHGEVGGINKYVSQIVNCLDNNKKIKQVDIFAKINAKKISKKNNIFINNNNFLYLILSNLKTLIKSDKLNSICAYFDFLKKKNYSFFIWVGNMGNYKEFIL
jgi:hypothetical protein